jgi:hypothetical protein
LAPGLFLCLLSSLEKEAEKSIKFILKNSLEIPNNSTVQGSILNTYIAPFLKKISDKFSSSIFG